MQQSARGGWAAMQGGSRWGWPSHLNPEPGQAKKLDK